MHELSVAMSIADLALDEARKAEAKQIKELEVEIGEWAGVDSEGLLFSLDAVLKSNPVLRHTKVTLRKHSPLMHCGSCHSDFRPKAPYIRQCERCGAENVELLHGRELSLKSLTIDD